MGSPDQHRREILEGCGDLPAGDAEAKPQGLLAGAGQALGGIGLTDLLKDPGVCDRFIFPDEPDSSLTQADVDMINRAAATYPGDY